MGLFRRDKEKNEEEPVIANGAPPVDLMRFDRLVQNSLKLHELGVPYEAIKQRAARDAVTFNEALEALYRVHVRG